MAEKKGRFKEDEFVSKVVRDPKQPPDTLLLSGFLGASSEEGCVRIYFDAQLSDYVEIPEDAILHTQEMPNNIWPGMPADNTVPADAILSDTILPPANRTRTALSFGYCSLPDAGL